MRIVVMLLALMPLVSFAKCNTPVECYQQAIEGYQQAIEDLRDARAEIKMARDEVKKVKEDAEKKIKDLTVSMEKTDAKITALLKRLDGSAKKVTQLVDAVSVSENGNVGIGTTNQERGRKLHISGGSVRIDVSGGGQVQISTPVEGPGLAIFDTTNTQAFNLLSTTKYNRIDSDGRPIIITDGNVGIGTTTPEGPLHIKTTRQGNAFSDGIGFLKGSGGNDYQLQINAVGGVPHIDFSRSANEDFDMRLAVYTENELVIQGGEVNVRESLKAKTITETSDERLKKNIQPLVSSLAKLAQLRGVSFKWKDEPQDNQIGLVAQEVEKILPEIVSTDSEGYKSIAYGKLTAVLLEAIKEQQQQIDELNKRLEQK